VGKYNKAALHKEFETQTFGLEVKYIFRVLDGVMEGGHFTTVVNVQASKGGKKATWKHQWDGDQTDDVVVDPGHILPKTEDERLEMVTDLVIDYLKATGTKNSDVDKFFNAELAIRTGELSDN
jgi:hypothetical protein